jgi:hypothetical protein
MYKNLEMINIGHAHWLLIIHNFFLFFINDTVMLFINTYLIYIYTYLKVI